MSQGFKSNALPLLLILCFVRVKSSLCLAQVTTQPVANASRPQSSGVEPKPLTPVVHTSDAPDMVRETQLGVREPGQAGLIWWIPFEFWLEAAAKEGVTPEKARQRFVALKDYTVVGIMAAQVSGLGGFTFVPAEKLRKGVVLRDSSGTEYSRIEEPAPDAQNLAALMKPILANAIGKAGENFELLFFPARARDGQAIADATKKGKFSVVLKNLVGVEESVYEFRLPLTSVVEPKYCPAGKERVNANWEYCPWHGVALNPAASAK